MEEVGSTVSTDGKFRCKLTPVFYRLLEGHGNLGDRGSLSGMMGAGEKLRREWEVVELKGALCFLK